jgi:hypothetical protein
MTQDTIPAATIVELATTPGAILVGEHVSPDGSGWTVKVVPDDDLASGQVPITAWSGGPVVSHELVNQALERENGGGHNAFDSIAQSLNLHVEACMASARRGDAAIAAEVAEDAAAYAKYVI